MKEQICCNLRFHEAIHLCLRHFYLKEPEVMFCPKIKRCKCHTALEATQSSEGDHSYGWW